MRVFMCEKCEARSRVCVCLETLCMDLMHVMDWYSLGSLREYMGHER